MTTFLPKPGGRDRPDRKRAMRDVSQAPCPERGYDGAVHLLRNNANAVTRCTFCRKTWAELDEALDERGVV